MKITGVVTKNDEDDNSKTWHKLCLILSILLWLYLIWQFYCALFRDCENECTYSSSYSGDCWYSETTCESPCFQYSDDSLDFIMIPLVVITYIIYLFDSFCRSSTIKYINNTYDWQTIEKMVNDDWRKANMQIKWVVQNYHKRRTRDSNGHTKTKRINTARFEKVFEYTNIEDLSGIYELRDKAEAYNAKSLIKLQFDTKLAFANQQTENSYNNQLYHFVTSSKTDVYQDFSMIKTIPGFQARVMCQTQSVCCFNMAFYTIFSLLGFSWIYRVYLDAKSARKSFDIVKRITSY